MSGHYREPSAACLPCDFESIEEFLSEPTDQVLEVLERWNGPFVILGAGGKIGLHLSLMLRMGLDRLGRKDRVIAVSRFRTLRDRQSFESRGIETYPCDLSEPDEVKALPDAPVVFFLAGIKFGTTGSPELLRKMNIETPRNVAEHYRNSRVIAFSSGCVYPFMKPSSGGATEHTDPDPVGEYAASCIERENAFYEGSDSNGNPVAIIRLNYAIEFRYGILVDIGQKILKGEPIDLTTGYVNLIWQRDAVAKTIQSLELAASPAVPINITSQEIYRVKDLASRLGEALQRPVSFVGESEPTAWLSNPRQSYETLGPPETPINDMIAWVAAWLLTKGETWGKPTGYDCRDGRF